MATNYTQNVAAEVRAEMARQRLAQRVLAEKVGWSQQVLSARLSGTVAFSTDELEVIASALGVPLAQLVSPAVEATG